MRNDWPLEIAENRSHQDGDHKARARIGVEKANLFSEDLSIPALSTGKRRVAGYTTGRHEG